MLAFENEISMDLITHNGHAVLHAEITDCGQLLFRPDSSDRIVRIAEEKELYVFGFQLLLKVSHIHMVAVVVAQHQRTADHSSSIICDNLGKWIVNR